MAIYYCFISYCYYRTEITRWLFIRRGGKKEPKEILPNTTTEHLSIVHELVSEVGQVIRRAAETKPAKPELLFSLQSTIKDFILLEQTQYKRKINLYIAEELEIHGIRDISIEDIENLWK